MENIVDESTAQYESGWKNFKFQQSVQFSWEFVHSQNIMQGLDMTIIKVWLCELKWVCFYNVDLPQLHLKNVYNIIIEDVSHMFHKIKGLEMMTNKFNSMWS